MIDIFNIKDDIVKVLFWLNLILLVIGIFVSSKTYFISVIIINLIFNGTFMIISKYSKMFQSKNGMFGDLFGKLGNTLDYVNSMGEKDGKVQG